jgi:hypothetical protein
MALLSLGRVWVGAGHETGRVAVVGFGRGFHWVGVSGKRGSSRYREVLAPGI